MEHIDNPCYVTLAVNPKEYFELFQDYSASEKHKQIKKVFEEWNFITTPTELNL